MEQAKTDEVDDETHGADPEDHLRVVDVLGLVEPLEALHRDGEAERHQEHRVDERAQHLGARPAEGVLGPRLGRHAHAEEGDHQRRDVGQHVEAVSHQRHRVGQVT